MKDQFSSLRVFTQAFSKLNVAGFAASSCLSFLLFVPAAAGISRASEPLTPGHSGTIHRVVIEQAREEVPRADTASVVELAPGRLMMVYHRYRASEHGGSDFGPCSIWSQASQDGGRTWGGAREIVAAEDGDINVQAPAICHLPGGELLLLANHAHGKSSTTMELHRSKDDGQTWQFDQTLWEKSDGQWLQGGNSQLLLLESGRLIFGVHGGTGTQAKQKTDADAEFTNLDCMFMQSGDAIVTYAVARPAWARKSPSLSLYCAVVPREFFTRSPRDTSGGATSK